jgi:hypothetical protein
MADLRELEIALDTTKLNMLTYEIGTCIQNGQKILVADHPAYMNRASQFFF